MDLLILDPPYNLGKVFNGRRFSKVSVDEYGAWFRDVLSAMLPLLKPTASVYVCCEWLTSQSVYPAICERLTVRNRITWEREKGRGSDRNWKNASEDLWFCTVSCDYTFNAEAVKLRRRVVAPYKAANGEPKDWTRTASGDYRDTYPSNLWTDITVPFWSMAENTNHPTQKSEKFMAKIILASSNKGDFVLDPFLGSGTTSVVAEKLGRRYLGIERDEDYCIWAERRLELARDRQSIQGYMDGVFWERNSSPLGKDPPGAEEPTLF